MLNPALDDGTVGHSTFGGNKNSRGGAVGVMSFQSCMITHQPFNARVMLLNILSNDYY